MKPKRLAIMFSFIKKTILLTQCKRKEKKKKIVVSACCGCQEGSTFSFYMFFFIIKCQTVNMVGGRGEGNIDFLQAF